MVNRKRQNTDFSKFKDIDKDYNKSDYLVTDDNEDNLIKEHHSFCHQNDYGDKRVFDLDKNKKEKNEYITDSNKIDIINFFT